MTFKKAGFGVKDWRAKKGGFGGRKNHRLMPPSAGSCFKKGQKVGFGSKKAVLGQKRGFCRSKKHRLVPPSAGFVFQKGSKKGQKRGFWVKKVVLGVKTAFPMGYTPFGPIAGA